jgi:hypothetical protein
MAMISALKLVLNQHPPRSCYVFAQDVRAEGTDIFFLGFKFQFYANGFSEELEILF